MTDLNNANEETGEFKEEAVKLTRKLQAEITNLKRHISLLLLIADKAETNELEDIMVEQAKDAVNESTNK